MALSPPQKPHTPVTPGLRLIIAYKVAKVPVMLTLALWLTVSPRGAYDFVESIAEDLAAGSALWSRLGEWIQVHLSTKIIRSGAVLAWVDAITTAVEATLLLLRKPWAEWMVTIGIGLLIPLELLSLERRPGLGKVFALLINAAVVVYLARRRIKAARAGHDVRSG